MKFNNKTDRFVRLISLGEIIEISPEQTAECELGEELILEYVDRKAPFEVVKKTGYGRRRRNKLIVYYQCRAKYIVSKLIDEEDEDFAGYDIRDAKEDNSLVFHANVGYAYPTLSYMPEPVEEEEYEEKNNNVIDDYDSYWLLHEDPNLLEFCDKNEHKEISEAIGKHKIPSILSVLVSVPLFSVCFYLNRVNDFELHFITATALMLMILAFNYLLTNHFTYKNVKKYSPGNKLNKSK